MMAKTSADKWLTTDECAAYVKLKPQTIREYVHQGKIPYYKVGNRLRFNRTEIDKWFEQYHMIALTYTQGGPRSPSTKRPVLVDLTQARNDDEKDDKEESPTTL